MSFSFQLLEACLPEEIGCATCGNLLDEMSARELRRTLRKKGCVELRQKGSHLQVQCGRCKSTVPVHKGRDIKRGTLGAIERSLELCLGDDFLDDGSPRARSES